MPRWGWGLRHFQALCPNPRQGCNRTRTVACSRLFNRLYVSGFHFVRVLSVFTAPLP